MKEFFKSLYYGCAEVVSQFLGLSVGGQLAIVGGLFAFVGVLWLLAIVDRRYHAPAITPSKYGYGHEPERYDGEKVVLHVDFQEKH